MMRKLLHGAVAISVASLAAAGVLWPSGAHADPSISIGIGSSPTTVVSAAPGGLAGFTAANYLGTGYSYNISATGSPLEDQPIFDTTSTQVKSLGTAGSAFVWITQQGLSAPLGINAFLSGFTSNTWTAGVVSVMENTYISTSNALFGGTLLASELFTAPLDSVSIVANTPSLSNPFSETVEYIVNFGGAGTANDTIDVAAIPEPASLALLGVGLAGLGVRYRRRRA
jgi:PEP-CTERM motif